MEFNLADLWEAVVDTVPDREALICPAASDRDAGIPRRSEPAKALAERRLSYAQADERMNRLAHVLAEGGVGPGDHVALYLYNGTEYLEAMFAAFKLRAVPVNVNYRYVEDELRYLLDNSDSKAVIFHREFAPKLAAIRDELPQLTTFIAVDDESGADLAPLGAVDYEEALAGASFERDFDPRSADDVYILYTGGTTGMPKGVEWRHEDIFHAALSSFLGPLASPEEIVEKAPGGSTRTLPACPFMHGTAHWMALGSLFSGGTVIIDAERHMDPLHIWQLVQREGVTFLVIVGDAMGRPLAEAFDQLDPPLDTSRPMILLSGGAILSPSVKRDLAAKLEGGLVLDGIGSSEAGGQGQMAASKDGDAPAQPRFAMTPQNTVLTDDFKPAAVGEVGMLARSGNIPLGYYKDPEKSAATFPVVDGVRWSVPGDHARIEEDGTITVLGRGSVSINTGGEKVYPEEVEGALKGHEDVFDAVVVGVPDERWGERVVAVVQPRDGRHATLDALNEHVRSHIASYKAPRDLVEVEAITRSPSGKPDYRWAQRVAMDALGITPS